MKAFLFLKMLVYFGLTDPVIFCAAGFLLVGKKEYDKKSNHIKPPPIKLIASTKIMIEIVFDRTGIERIIGETLFGVTLDILFYKGKIITAR